MKLRVPNLSPAVSAISTWLIVVVPAIVLAFLIRQTSVNVPHWDDWAMVSMYLDAREGRWDPATLFDSHVEHRWAITRLLTLGFNFASGADQRVQHFASLVFAVAACAFLVLITRRTVAHPIPATLAGLFGTMFLLSPTQWQNWLWGVNFAYFIVVACLMFAAWQTSRDPSPLRAFASLVAAALVATFSFSTGLAMWPALLVCIVAVCVRRRTWLPAVGWVVIGSAVLAFYFLVDPENKAIQSHSPLSDGSTGFSHTLELLRESPGEVPARVSLFYLSLLGNPLCRGLLVRSQEFAPVLGGILLFLILLAGMAFFRKAGRKSFSLTEEFLATAPWITLVAFGLIAAASITLGRVGMYAPTGALFGRYVTFPSLAWVGLAGFVATLLSRRHPATFTRPVPVLVAGLAAGVLLSLLSANWYYGARQMYYWSWGRQHGQAALRFAHLLPAVDLSLIEGDGTFARAQARRLNALGLLEYPMFENLRLDNIKISKREVKERLGSIRLVPGSERPRVEGVALMDGPERPADAILFVTQLNGERTVFDLTRASALTPHIRAVAGRDAEHMALRQISSEEFGSYSRELNLDVLPPGEHEVEAWIYSIEKNTVWRIPGSVRVSKAAR